MKFLESVDSPRVRRLVALALVGSAIMAGSATGHDHIATARAGQSQHAGVDGEKPFLAENEAAMTEMMVHMGVAPTGDADRDFVAMMIPHHQGAIDMAQAILRHGRNETLRRLAQEIIVTQRDEIAAMRLAIGATPSPLVR